MFLDLLVHQRLSQHWLVHLVVTVPSVAHHIHYNVIVERRPDISFEKINL